MNLMRLKRSRKRPDPGTFFVYFVERTQKFGFGRVIRDDAVVGPWKDLFLLYFYSDFSDTKAPPESLGAGDLLLPPVFSNQRPWTQGYFENVFHRPLASGEVLSFHCFRDIRGFFVDEYGNRLDSPADPCGEYRLESFQTIDDLISDKIGIPIAEDET